MWGDEDRFRALYEAHYALVLRFAVRRVDPEAARDVAAETFLVAWRRLERVPEDPGEALPWLYGVARNVLANEQRGQRRSGRLAARLGAARPVVTDTASDHAGSVVEVLRIREAMGRLPPRDQETLQLVAWDGLDVAGAARVVGCSARAFSVRLHRARRRLERELGEPPQEPAEEWDVAVEGSGA